MGSLVIHCLSNERHRASAVIDFLPLKRVCMNDSEASIHGRMSSMTGLDLDLSEQQSGHAGEGKFPVDRAKEKAPSWGLFSLHQ